MGTRLLVTLSMALTPLCSAHGADSPTFTPTPTTSNPAPSSNNSSVPAEKPLAEPAGNFTAVDALIADASRSVTTLQDCMKLASTLKADHAAKQRELKEEFSGKIPPAFQELLTTKRKRADKQQTHCLQESPRANQIYVQAHEALRSFEPKSAPGIAARGKKLDAIKFRYNQLFPSAKALKE